MKKKENNKELKQAIEEKKPLTPQQLQKRKKMVIFPLFFLLFAVSMWFIFAPSGDKSEETGATHLTPTCPHQRITVL